MGAILSGGMSLFSGGGPLPIPLGGTGANNAPGARNNLLPAQGGYAGYALVTDGTNVSWVNVATNPGGANGQIQFNDSGVFAGSPSFIIDKITGALTSTATFTNQGLSVSNAAGTNRYVSFQTSGSNRWALVADTAAETGSNAGSNFEILAYSDDGVTNSPVLSISRLSKIIDFKTTPTINGVPIGAGSGTVLSVNATGSNGITVSGVPITTTGTIALGLGNITPTSVAATGTVTGSNLSGTNTGDQTITLTGDVTGTGTGTFATTLSTVNSTPGVFGSVTNIPVLTVDSKGRITSITTVPNNPLSGKTTNYNTALGVNALAGVVEDPINSYGIQNVAIGNDALKLSEYAYNLVAIGFKALASDLGSGDNIAIGTQALYSNEYSWGNVAIGTQSQYNLTGGYNNISVGNYSLFSTVSSHSNTAIGGDTLYSNTSGTNNSALGASSLYSNTTGEYNTGVGSNALKFNTTGSNNSALGSGALLYSTTGANSTAVGAGALGQNTTGNSNTAVGTSSLGNNTTGSWNVAVGVAAFGIGTENSFNTVVGATALNGGWRTSVGDNNTAIGYNALSGNTGNTNTVIGYNSGNAIEAGSYNVIIGSNTGSDIANSNNNIIISDGQGNIRISVDGSGVVTIPGAIIASGGITGNAATATKLQTARTISISGDVAGSVSFDGSANADIVATIQPNSVALGTDTTGNYIATGAVSGNGLSGSAAGEGSVFTVTSNATSSNTPNTIVFRDASGNFSAGNITGNASTATALQTARSITITGPTVGSAYFDGTSNIIISTTVQPNSIALGTDTTGNYIATGSVIGNGISGSASSEGSTFTITSNATNLNTPNTTVFRDASGNFSAGIITATQFNGPISGTLIGNAETASALQTARTISMTGDASWFVSFDGSADVTSPIILSTVNTSPQTDTFRKITVNSKGLVTGTSTVTPTDITTALAYTPVNKAGDTMSGLLILSGDPSAALGAATKQYVDNMAAGVNVHMSCETGTTAPLPACTYNNGTSGVGATLTASANGALGTVGGYASLYVSARVLVKDQVSQLQNGIYVVTSLGSGTTPWVLTRSSDFDGSPTFEVGAGDLTFVQNGTLAGTQWVETAPGTGTGGAIIIGTNPIVFSQFSGAGTYVGGAGISVASNTISNTGVLSNIAGTGITVSGTTGNVTIGTANIPNSSLTNSSITIGSTNIALGDTTVTLAGLSSVSSTSFAGALSGNASTATTLQTARNINGVSFNGSADITVTAAAGTLTGTTLNSTVTASSLTSVGTLTSGAIGSGFTAIPNSALANSSVTVNGTAISLGGSGTVTAAAGTLTGTTLAAGVTASSLTSVGTLSSLTLGGTLYINNATSPNTHTVQWGDGSGWTLRYMTNISGTPTQRFSFTDTGNFTATGTLSGTSFNSITALSSTTPAAPGTAAVGTSTTVARADHVHPLQTNITGNAGTATNISGGTAGALVVQVADGNTGFINPGTTGYILTSTGTGSAPSWQLNQPQANNLTGSTLATGVTFSSLTSVGTITTGTWSGSFGAVSGANLTNITGANVTGTVASATTAATANALNNGNSYQVNSLGVGTPASGTAGEIRATNNITAYYSDDRLKTRTGNIENALEKVSTLDAFYYHANETAEALGYKPVPEVGISAQQVQAIMPEVVAPAPIDEKYLTVRYEKLVPLLIAAIKELQEEIAQLKLSIKA